MDHHHHPNTTPTPTPRTAAGASSSPQPPTSPSSCPPVRAPHAYPLDRHASEPFGQHEEAAGGGGEGAHHHQHPPPKGQQQPNGGSPLLLAVPPVPPDQGGGLVAAVELRLVSPALESIGGAKQPPPGSISGSAGGQFTPGSALPPVEEVAVPVPPSYKRLRLFLMACVTWSATLQSCLGPFFPLHMREHFNASALLIGGVFAALSISQSLVGPFIAALSHRIGRANTLRLGILLSIVGGVLFSVDQIWAFYISRILQGIGDGMIDNAAIAITMHHSPNLNRDVGLLEGSSSLGYLFGPLLSGLLYDAIGFRPLFFAFTAPFALLLLLACLAPRLVLPGATARHSKEEEAADEEEAGRQGNALLRALQALRATPSYLVYLCMVLLVAGALGFFDTSLAEHLAVALDVSSFEAGLLFTIQIMVYVPFSLIAAEVALRFGEWPAILGGSAVWACGMFLIGPDPSLHMHIKSRRAALVLISSTLAVLGAAETMVFIPFVPLLHAHLRGPRHGWAAAEAEDAVAAMWTTAFAAGQTLGPLVGGGLMDALPNVQEIGCVIEEGRTQINPGEEGGPCLSSFAWVSTVWGVTGMVGWGLLVACLVGERAAALAAGEASTPASKGGQNGGSKGGLVAWVARRCCRHRRRKRDEEEEAAATAGAASRERVLSVPIHSPPFSAPSPLESAPSSMDGAAAYPIPLPPRLQMSGRSGARSYTRGTTSGLGRRPILMVTRSAAMRGMQDGVGRSYSSSMLAGPSHSRRQSLLGAGGGGSGPGSGGRSGVGMIDEERPQTH